MVLIRVILSGRLLKSPCRIEERNPTKRRDPTAFRVSLFDISSFYPLACAGLQIKYPTTRLATMTSQNVTVQLVI
jgi:hypothetical protein